MAEGEYRPVPQNAVERQPQGIPPLDAWMVQRIQQEQQYLEEGENVDPWYVSDSFFTYRNYVVMRMADLQGAANLPEAEKAGSPEEKAFLASIDYTHDAFDIVAYRYYRAHQRQTISEEVYEGSFGAQPRSKEPFTLSAREKETLQEITKAIDIPDDPQQRTYSLASIQPASEIVDSEEEE
jgi:hypothetical protein